MSFFSGAIKDVEVFFCGVERDLMTDYGPALALVRGAFSDALGNLESTAYSEAKTVINGALTAASAGGGNIGVIVKTAFDSAKAALPAAGITIGDAALHGLVSALAVPLAP